MVDTFRRVEPRSLIGSGLANDPDRLDEIKHDAELRARTNRLPPEHKFSEFLVEAKVLPPPLREGKPMLEEEIKLREHNAKTYDETVARLLETRALEPKSTLSVSDLPIFVR